jgi:hypothetical protein
MVWSWFSQYLRLAFRRKLNQALFFQGVPFQFVPGGQALIYIFLST